ncbi:MAG: tRNA (adenosine(37)-N6)-threonylcarbamoyltransferase complex ATPase subunit type 1 TsaE [Leptospiraceae bacterium]|nr:tRNA (adenosine(37)-N6)-threonylcarbamoyltransferase complex ATPase subunit type 1 TsaE [Leptospiraceae bacterium]
MKLFKQVGLEDYLSLFEIIQKEFLEQQKLNIIALSGEMGAGKTTFTRNLLQYLGTPDLVNSPTFSLLNEYTLNNGMEIFHFDLYRLQDISEVDELGFESIWGHKGLSIIEWWQKADELIPYPRLQINISIESSETRNIEIEIVEDNK